MSSVVKQEKSSNEFERYQLGEVVLASSIDPTSYGFERDDSPRSIYEVIVRDPYVEMFSDAESEKVRLIERYMSDFAKSRREQGLWQRKPGTAYTNTDDLEIVKKSWQWGDPVSTDLFFNRTLKSPGIDAWRTKIPSARALADLSDPFSAEYIFDRKGREVKVDEDARVWLTLCTDARAIRSRATVMAESVKAFIEENGSDTQNDFAWMSVACGTALPAMKAAIHSGISPSMLLVDFDKSALQSTSELASEIGFSGALSQRSDINIFDKDAMLNLKKDLADKNQLPHLIDLMGIFEYTGNNLGVDPVEFLSSVYDILRPGGRLIFGQMRNDRPVQDFTMGVVGWPYVELRSPKEFMDIIAAASIPSKNTQLYLPDDGVYTVGVIDKPR